MNKSRVSVRSARVGAFIAAGIAATVWAADGDLDAGFGTAGVVKLAFPSALTAPFLPELRSAAVQADTTILVAGTAEECSLEEEGECDIEPNSPIYIARLNSNGTLNGAVTTALAGASVELHSVKVTGNGKVLAFGQHAPTTEDRVGIRVARLSAAGVVEAEYKQTPTATLVSSCYTGIVDAAGKIVASCISGNPTTGVFAPTVLRLNADLTPDTSFGSNGFVTLGGSDASAVLQEPGGGYLILGSSETIIEGSDPEDPETIEKAIVVRLSSAGALDAGFGDGGIKVVTGSFVESEGNALARDDSGRIYVCGEGETVDADVTFLARLTATGAIDTTFSGDGVALLDGLDDCEQMAAVGQKIYVLSDSRLHRLNADGSTDASFDSTPTATALTANGNCSYWSGLTLLDNYNALLLGAVDPVFCPATPKPATLPVAKVALSAAPPDTTPNAFTFTDVSDAEKSTLTTSNGITVSGINAPAAISVSGGSYSINGGAFTSTAGTVSNGATVRVQLSSSASKSDTVSATLNIGGVSDAFSVTTKGGGGGGGALSPFTLLLMLIPAIRLFVDGRRRKRLRAC